MFEGRKGIRSDTKRIDFVKGPCSVDSPTGPGTQGSGGRSEEPVRGLPYLQNEIGECNSSLGAGSFTFIAKVAPSGRQVLESARQRTVGAGGATNRESALTEAL
jgi:hypothetical protein